MNPEAILAEALAGARELVANGISRLDSQNQEKLEKICRCNTNKAPIRFLMACLLAKIHRPEADIRKPYTEIGGDDCYSGRAYDESYLSTFITQHRLPCNSTTAFLTPAFRNIDRLLTPELMLVGKPKEIYQYSLELLNLVFTGSIPPEKLLTEILSVLLLIKAEQDARMEQLLEELASSNGGLPLSSEQILTLLQQHLACKNSSRLPVLMVSAAYQSIAHKIQEQTRPLESHSAADKQTGSISDVEIETAAGRRATCYEMKDKRVDIQDINIAISKVGSLTHKPDNYIFITTDLIDREVVEYALALYEKTGVEFVILDCLGFIRHFLHFFHRERIHFLDHYQQLVLTEASSAVGQPLKEAFLALRRQAESD